MTVLKQPPKTEQGVPKLPPLMLSTPAMVAEHTPCTLHPSILPPELACRLFYTMFDASRQWSRNKWWLFDRLVESPHRTSFFARAETAEGSVPAAGGAKKMDDSEDSSWQEAAQFWYNGRVTEAPPVFPLKWKRPVA
ncbi:hypothetical protein B0H14DRAFT_213140 [Mycena olivaceomarginata]|nr:hypothetical protein B0H14DRAFT_213140 [Mycena olivaceomarginata]